MHALYVACYGQQSGLVLWDRTKTKLYKLEVVHKKIVMQKYCKFYYIRMNCLVYLFLFQIAIFPTFQTEFVQIKHERYHQKLAEWPRHFTKRDRLVLN